jgi:hypothetical protein
MHYYLVNLVIPNFVYSQFQYKLFGEPVNSQSALLKLIAITKPMANDGSRPESFNKSFK